MNDTTNGVKLTHTMAILSYLGRTHGLAPQEVVEKILFDVDMLREEAKDLCMDITNFCYKKVCIDK